MNQSNVSTTSLPTNPLNVMQILIGPWPHHHSVVGFLEKWILSFFFNFHENITYFANIIKWKCLTFRKYLINNYTWHKFLLFVSWSRNTRFLEVKFIFSQSNFDKNYYILNFDPIYTFSKHCAPRPVHKLIRFCKTFFSFLFTI